MPGVLEPGHANRRAKHLLRSYSFKLDKIAGALPREITGGEIVTA